METDKAYVQHILDAIKNIQEYLAQKPRDVFFEDSLLQSGVIRQLEIIGEAARHLSTDYRNKHQNIPWEDVIGMRDQLIHGYMGVDLNQVWDTTQHDLTDLKEDLLHD